MDSPFVFYGAHFLTQMVFLVLCMHVAGRKLGIDFGRFWPVLIKAAVLLSVVLTVLLLLDSYVHAYRWKAIGGLVALAYWYGLRIAFGLDEYEVFPLMPICCAGTLVLYFAVNLVLRHGQIW